MSGKLELAAIFVPASLTLNGSTGPTNPTLFAEISGRMLNVLCHAQNTPMCLRRYATEPAHVGQTENTPKPKHTHASAHLLSIPTSRPSVLTDTLDNLAEYLLEVCKLVSDFNFMQR